MTERPPTRLPDGGARPAASLILIVGPTASGKSTLAETVALRCGGEIVSADALQVYRGLDIGTAKPSAATRARIPHHCLDLFAPTERCTAGRFATRARRAIGEVIDRDHPCLFAGGTGFYVAATLDGLDALPRTDPRWRARIEALADRRGPTWLHTVLERHDAGWAARIGPTDRQRLVRAVEVVLRTGRGLRQQPSTPPFAIQPALEIGLRWPRPALRARIDARVEQMIEAGWLQEIEGLLAAGVPPDAHALQAIGYRDLVAVLQGESTLEVAKRRIRTATRRYARRQESWFRRRPGVRWHDIDPTAPVGSLERVAEVVAASLLESTS